MTENKTFKIEGKATHIELEGGFWGIIGKEGHQWQPVNMPEQLKRDGTHVECVVRETDAATAFMWGDPVEIISFETP